MTVYRYRTLHLLGDLETINLPNNYLEALRGINAVADTLLSVGAPVLSKPAAQPVANQSGTATQGQIQAAVTQAAQASTVFDQSSRFRLIFSH